MQIADTKAVAMRSGKQNLRDKDWNGLGKGAREWEARKSTCDTLDVIVMRALALPMTRPAN